MVRIRVTVRVWVEDEVEGWDCYLGDDELAAL